MKKDVKKRVCSVDSRLKRIMRLLKVYHPERVILFGSYARGSNDPYSDLDLVIIKQTRKRFLNRLKEVIQIINPRFSVDILVYTPEEFRRMVRSGNPFIQSVVREGKILYEKR